MNSLMNGVLNRYGVEATLQTATGEKTLKVFFRSVNSSAWQNVERVFASLGEIPVGKYLCVLPADAEAAPEDTITVHGRRYLLRRVEQVSVFTGPVYCWCLCVEKGSEDTWGSDGL